MKFSTILLLVIPTLLSSLVFAQDQSFTELIRKLNLLSSLSLYSTKKTKNHSSFSALVSLHKSSHCTFARDCHHHLTANAHHTCRNHECRSGKLSFRIFF